MPSQYYSKDFFLLTDQKGLKWPIFHFNFPISYHNEFETWFVAAINKVWYNFSPFWLLIFDVNRLLYRAVQQKFQYQRFCLHLAKHSSRLELTESFSLLISCANHDKENGKSLKYSDAFVKLSCLERKGNVSVTEKYRLTWKNRPTFRDATTGFPSKWRLRNEPRNSTLMTCH